MPLEYGITKEEKINIGLKIIKPLLRKIYTDLSAVIQSVPDLDQKKDELMYTAKQIVESIAPKIKDDKIFEILSNTYYEYKKQLQFIKELVVYKKYHKIYEKGDIKNKEPEIQTNMEEKELSNKSPTINSKDKTKQEPKIEFSNIKKRKKLKKIRKEKMIKKKMLKKNKKNKLKRKKMKKIKKRKK